MQKNVRCFNVSTLFLCLACFATLLLSDKSLLLAQQPQQWRYEKDVQRYEKLSEETPPNEDTTFFVGSSTFTGWKNIPDDFKEFHAINRGFGGSQISDWNFAATKRLLAPYRPNRIVFFCGCNDIASGKTTEKTLEDFKQFLKDVREINPDVSVHFCSLHLPPVREKFWNDFRAFNENVKKMAEEDENLYYVDFTTATCDEKGNGNPELFQIDGLHLTRQGQLVLVPIILQSIRNEVEKNNTQTKE